MTTRAYNETDASEKNKTAQDITYRRQKATIDVGVEREFVDERAL
jgi:hypothetical protein